MALVRSYDAITLLLRSGVCVYEYRIKLRDDAGRPVEHHVYKPQPTREQVTMQCEALLIDYDAVSVQCVVFPFAMEVTSIGEVREIDREYVSRNPIGGEA